MSVVQFDVEYRLSEYRAFVLDHFATVTHKRPGFFTSIFVSAVAAITFALKKYKMPLCSFEIDEGGIRRRTKAGEISVPWSEVAAIHKYSRGLLIEKSHGGIATLRNTVFRGEDCVEEIHAVERAKWGQVQKCT